MRVLAVSHAYPRRDYSSHGIFIHRLHQGLRAAGAEVDVIQRADWSPPWPLALALSGWRRDRAARRMLMDEIDGIRIHHPLTVTPRPSRFFPGDSWDRDTSTMVNYVARRKALARPDIVLGHFMVPDGFHAVRLARSLGVPAAVMAWGDDVHAWPSSSSDWLARLRWVLQETDVVIACSRQLATDANCWLDGPRDDWNVVYAGVDLDSFFPSEDRLRHRNLVLPADLLHRIGNTGRIILTLAQPCIAKGYLELLDAWARVAGAATGWYLIMAGGLGGDLSIPQEIDRRGIQGTAFWIGAQDPQQVPDLLRASDGFVLASHNEGLSLSVLEALASGLPTIATDVGGHAEVITHGTDGWLVPPRDVASLQQALVELTTSVGERNRRSAAARTAAERIGSHRDNATRLAHILERSIDRHRDKKLAPLLCYP